MCLLCAVSELCRLVNKLFSHDVPCLSLCVGILFVEVTAGFNSPCDH